MVREIIALFIVDEISVASSTGIICRLMFHFAVRIYVDGECSEWYHSEKANSQVTKNPTDCRLSNLSLEKSLFNDRNAIWMLRNAILVALEHS